MSIKPEGFLWWKKGEFDDDKFAADLVQALPAMYAQRGFIDMRIVKDTIEETPPELVSDLMTQGIALAGGGALLAGLDERLSHETKMRVYRADDPLTCVVRGSGRALEEMDKLGTVFTND